MNLAEAIAASVKPKGTKCSVTLMLESLDEGDRAVMVEALGNPTITHTQLADGIVLAGLPRVLAQTLSRHRKGECRCPR